jgi:hypothetical protein
MPNPLDAILNTNPAPPTYTGTAYSAPANSAASQAAQQVNPGVGDMAGIMPQQQGSPLPSANLASLAPDPVQQAQQKVDQPGGLKGMLKGFLWGMSRGMMAHAGIEAPEQTQLKQQQLAVQQQQANTQEGYRQFQQKVGEFGMDQVPVFNPFTGQMQTASRKDAPALQKEILKAQGGLAKQDSANVGRMNVAQLTATLAAQKGGKFVPDIDANGRQFYHIFNPYGHEIGQADVNAIPSFLVKNSTTQDIKQLDDGTIVSIPKTTTSGPVLPGKGAPRVGGGGGVVTIKDGNGEPIIGKGATTSATRTMIEAAPKVLTLAGRLKQEIQDLDKSGDLGPGASRWNDLWSGKVGTENPKFREMQTDSGLLSTLLMRMHVGARGSEKIMEHFQNMIGSGHQSAANMLAAIDSITQYANDVKAEAPLPKYPGGGGLQPTHRFNPATGQIEPVTK